MNWPPEKRQLRTGDPLENIRLKVLVGFKAGESASHLSKIYALSLDQVLEWKRLTTYGHTDWVDGIRRKYSIEEKRLILVKYFSQSLGYKRFASINNLSCRLLKNCIRKVKKPGSIELQGQLSSCKTRFEIIKPMFIKNRSAYRVQLSDLLSLSTQIQLIATLKL